MHVSELESQIVKILEDKYKHSIDQDDPLMLTITAQTLVTEHLLELHKANLEAQFVEFRKGLGEMLASSRVDSESSRKIFEENTKKVFLTVADSYKSQLDRQFLISGGEYQKARKLNMATKWWAVGSFTMFALSVLLTVFF